MSVVIGILLASIRDLPNLRREVTVNDDALGIWGQAGYLTTAASWPWRNVTEARLLRQEETGQLFGILFLRLARRRSSGWDVGVGVPADVEPERVATVLHGLGVPITLLGWEPGQQAPTDAKPAAAVVPADVGRVAGGTEVEVWPVPEPYAGKIQKNRRHLVPMLMIGLPVIVLMLGGLVAMGYTLWYRKELPLSRLAGTGLGGLATFIVGAGIGAQVLPLVTSRSLRGVARSEIRNRPDALVDPDDPEAVFVKVLPRRHWGAGAPKVAKGGFLQADRQAGCLLYEGDKERWRVSRGGLVSCTVERASVHVGQTDESQLCQYVAVVRSWQGAAVWERPLCAPHLVFGWLKNRDREAKAEALRQQILAALPVGHDQTAQPQNLSSERP
jgi:hypothetical protein